MAYILIERSNVTDTQPFVITVDILPLGVSFRPRPEILPIPATYFPGAYASPSLLRRADLSLVVIDIIFDFVRPTLFS